MHDYVRAVETAFAAGAERHLDTAAPVLWRDAGTRGVRSPSLKLSASVLRSEQLMGASVYSAHFTPGSLEMWMMLFSAADGRLAPPPCSAGANSACGRPAPRPPWRRTGWPVPTRAPRRSSAGSTGAGVLCQLPRL
ncbi:MAG: hypothetical protein M5U09_25335, partial [Gammaproteobacteria bacterium]|nr:hypothetical protein [Gammaproteobacteria bacterium]